MNSPGSGDDNPTVIAVHRTRSCRVVLAAALAFLPALSLSCMESGLSRCADGRICAAGLVCVDGAAQCALPAQLEACEDIDDGDECSYIGTEMGTCIDGVCIGDSCGDGMLAATEACDVNISPAQSCLDFGRDIGLVGCTSSCMLDLATCDYIGWTWESSATLDHLHRIWGGGPDDIYAVGNWTTIVHFDGEKWSGVDPLADDPELAGAVYHFRDVVGDADRVLAIGKRGAGGVTCELTRAEGTWSCAETAVEFTGVALDVAHRFEGQPGVTDIAATDAGTILRRDEPGRWSEWYASGASLAGLWSDGNPEGAQIFAVGGISGQPDTAVVVHYDGDSWSGDANLPGEVTDRLLRGVWGTSDGALEVFAVGDRGTIVHYAAGTWTAMESSTSEDLIGVWGTGPTQVFAVGGAGTILHYNGDPGGRWLPLLTDTSAPIRGLWGSDSRDIYAVGNEGTILHHTGYSWSPSTLTTTDRIRDLWGPANDDLLAVDSAGRILHYLDGAWSEVTVNEPEGAPPGTDLPNQFGKGALWSLWGSGPNDIYAVGDGSRVVRYGNGEWTETTIEVPNNQAKPMEMGGMTPVEPIELVNLRGVWGDAQQVLVASEHGAVYAFNRTEWVEVVAKSPRRSLRDFFARAADDVYAVGEDGAILYYDGGDRWDPRDSGTDRHLGGIWGDAGGTLYAVGDGGTVLTSGDGVTWTAMESNTLEGLSAVRGEPDGSRVYSIGSNGSVFRFDGAVWMPIDTGVRTALDAIWGDQNLTIFAGDSGTLLQLVTTSPEL